MTSHRYAVAALGLALLASTTACDNNKLLSVNKNPNAPEQVSAALLFPSATVSSVRRIRSDMEVTPSAFVHWPQYMSEYQYPEISYYQFRPTTADGWWYNWYVSPLQDLEQALRQAVTAKRPNQIAPILVIRAFDFSTMTGIWGDIPFSQAGLGDKAQITPIYDTQQSIYDSLLTNLAAASTMMGSDATLGFDTQDPVYAGDPAKWKKFANSLRARLGLNLSRVDAARAQAEVAAAINAGGFASNADNAQITWPADGINDNPWWDNQKEGQGTRDDARMSVTLIDTLKSLSDPRLSVYARPVQDSSCGDGVALCTVVANGGYRGMPNGLEAGDAGAWGTLASRMGQQVFAKGQPSYFMTYAEFAFIKAEAAERGWISGSAAQFYQDGITASMQQWGVPDTAITRYLAQASVTYKTGAAGLAQIGVQKWLALFTQGFEAWSEWRRTGYPNLTPALNARTADLQIPRRVIYPQTEQSFNNTHLQAAIQAQGGSDALNMRLWIDKQ